jgi:hypothetical protein
MIRGNPCCKPPFLLRIRVFLEHDAAHHITRHTLPGFKKLLFALTFLYAVVQERRCSTTPLNPLKILFKSGSTPAAAQGPPGLEHPVRVQRQRSGHMHDTAAAVCRTWGCWPCECTVSWADVHGAAADLNYGGRVTDDHDRLRLSA